MKNLIAVLVLAIAAVLTSSNVVAQNNAMPKDISMMTLAEVHGIYIERKKKDLANILFGLRELSGLSDNKANRIAKEKLFAEKNSLERALELLQVYVPGGSTNFSNEGHFRKGKVKNYNEGEDIDIYLDICYDKWLIRSLTEKGIITI